MSTRLSKEDCENAKTRLLTILNAGIQFIECPLTDEEKGIFWHRGFPDDLLDAYTVLNDHGVGVEYSATTRAIGFCIPADNGALLAVRLVMSEPNRGFFTITRKMMEDFKSVKLKDDRYTKWPLITAEQLVERLGDKHAEFVEWAVTASKMDAEICNATQVLNDLFGMIKTAGQLRRMVPDLFQYLPAEQRAAFEEQKRASTLPFEWTPYPREKVEAMLATLHKCHLLTGLGKPSMSRATADSDEFCWTSLREEEKAEDAAQSGE